MMSSPENVNVETPDTEEVRMTTVSSTGNLRHLVPPDPVAISAAQQAAAIQQQVAGMGMDTDGRRDRSPTSTRSMPIPSASSPQNGFPPQPQPPQEQTQPSEYTAWIIGSTEAIQKKLANSMGNRSQSAPPSALTTDQLSPYTSAILARCSSSRQPSPCPTENSSLASIPTPSGSPPPPPVTAATPPTLGGLSQSLSVDGSGGGGTTGGVQRGGGDLHQQPNQVSHTANNQQVGSGLPPLPPTPQNTPQQTQHHHQQQAPSYNKSLQQLYHTRLLSTPIPAVESLLSSSCEALNFDIAEMWLRTGPKTHQLTNSHVRATALDDSVRKQLVDVYYGERSAERTHRLSPALCKRSKEAGDVVWVTAHTLHGAEALKCSISDVRTAVAVPVCHMGSGVNVTIIYFSIRR